MIHVQTTTVDIPDDNLDQSKTLDMGFLHALLGTSEIQHLTVAFIDNFENSFQGLFFIAAVLSEIFANVSGMSLIYLLWTTDFIFPYGIYIVGCKVGRYM